MRILQLIDSLDAGGAERMAVNYANALSGRVAFSGLVATRKEGPLKDQLEADVSYLFLHKKKAFDLKAVLRLRRFVRLHQVTIVHTHGSSFFIAVLLKLFVPKLKVYWHDHYGNSEFLAKRKTFFLKTCSFFFEGILSVNTKLKIWAEQKLYSKRVLFLSNFVSFEETDNAVTLLKGTEGKRIVCLANLRAQKNHLHLLAIARQVKVDFPEWTFHLVGKDFKDAYSESIKASIQKNDLEQHVYLYDSRPDVRHILSQCEIGILTSSSEGLPVALLEYGYYQKPVVATNVGEIGTVIENGINGLLADADSTLQFYSQLALLITNSELREELGTQLKHTVDSFYTEKAVLHTYLEFLR